MRKTRRSKEERETIILWCELDKSATVTTSIPAVLRRMTRLFGKPAEEGDDWGRWSVPLAGVLPRRPPRQKPAAQGVRAAQNRFQKRAAT